MVLICGDFKFGLSKNKALTKTMQYFSEPSLRIEAV